MPGPSAFCFDATDDFDKSFPIADEKVSTLSYETNVCDSKIKPSLPRVSADTDFAGFLTELKMLIETGATTSFINSNNLQKPIGRLMKIRLT